MQNIVRHHESDGIGRSNLKDVSKNSIDPSLLEEIINEFKKNEMHYNRAINPIDTVTPRLWRGAGGEVLKRQFIGRRAKRDCFGRALPAAGRLPTDDGLILFSEVK